KQRRVVAVKLQAFFVDQKHRHARAIFALVKDLPGLIVLGLESGNIDRAKDGRLLRRDVVLVNRAWESERVEAVVNVLVVVQTAKATGSSEARQHDLVFEFAVETKYISARG